MSSLRLGQLVCEGPSETGEPWNRFVPVAIAATRYIPLDPLRRRSKAQYRGGDRDAGRAKEQSQSHGRKTELLHKRFSFPQSTKRMRMLRRVSHSNEERHSGGAYENVA